MALAKTISTSVDIAAPPAAVWRALIDLEGYADWNPYFIHASGRVAVGHRVTLRASLGEGRAATARPRVVVATSPRELRWISRMVLPGLLDAEHSFTLTPAGSRRTRMVQVEKLTGILVPVTGSTIAAIHRRCIDLDEALKRRVEGAPSFASPPD